MQKLKENMNTSNNKLDDDENNTSNNKVDDHLNIMSYKRVKHSIESQNNKIFSNLVKLT